MESAALLYEFLFGHSPAKLSWHLNITDEPPNSNPAIAGRAGRRGKIIIRKE